MDKSFIRSTTERRQSSFSVVLSLKSSSTAATSTDGPGCTGAEVEAGADGAAFVAPSAPVGPPTVETDAVGVAAAEEAGVLPSTFSKIDPKMFITCSSILRGCSQFDVFRLL